MLVRYLDNKKTKYFRNALICFLLISLVLMSFGFIRPKHVEAEEKADVWSATSGIKIMQYGDYDVSGGSAIQVYMAKNEYESAQLIISAKSDISSFDLILSDLSDGEGHILSKDSIQVFQQHYIETKVQSNPFYETGWYPDAIIPLVNTKQLKENRVKANQNQGLWIKFRTEKETVSGRYFGSFSLIIDGDAQSIPVSVTVWDFYVYDEVHTKSSFMLYSDALTQGEGDSSMEMYRTYYDYFLENRISLMNLPSSLNDEEFIEVLREYADNPKVSAYEIPYVGYDGNVDVAKISEVIKKIIVASVQDNKNYLEKAYIYNLYTDEYAGNAVKLEKAKAWATMFTNMKTELETFFDETFGISYLDRVEGLREDLQNLTDLAVTEYVPGVSDLTNGICSSFASFHTEENRQKIRSIFNEPGDEVWWYGCIGPQSPYPSYHIDDNILSSRILSWMQYDYGIDGNLYFLVNMYYGDAGAYLAYPVDEWSLANRNLGGGSVNGDGWLVYPGQKYGIDGPIGTIRLESIRDGLEEYEYLTYLENIFAEMRELYGDESLTVNNVTRTILDSIYTGVWTTENPQTFEQARIDLANVISLAEKDRMVIAEVKNNVSNFEVSVYMPKDVAVFCKDDNTSIVSETIVGSSGKKIVFKVMVQDEGDLYLNFDYSLNGETNSISYFLAKGKTSLIEFNSESAKKYISVSKDSSFALSELEGSPVYRFELASTDDISQIMTFKPYIGLNAEFLKLLNDNMKSLVIELYNAGDESITMSIVRRTSLIESTDLSVELPAKQWIAVELTLQDLEDVLFYKLTIPNKVSNGQAVSQVLYLKKISYVEE